jgi:hypothetical protein
VIVYADDDEAVVTEPVSEGRLELFDVEVSYAADAPLKRRLLVRATSWTEAEQRAIAHCMTSPPAKAPLKLVTADAGHQSLGERLALSELLVLISKAETLL